MRGTLGLGDDTIHEWQEDAEQDEDRDQERELRDAIVMLPETMEQVVMVDARSILRSLGIRPGPA